MDNTHWIDFNSPDYIFKDNSSNQGTPSPGHNASHGILQQSINQENIDPREILNENSSNMNPQQESSDQATAYYLQNLQKWTTLDLASENIISSPSDNTENASNTNNTNNPVNSLVINEASLNTESGAPSTNGMSQSEDNHQSAHSSSEPMHEQYNSMNPPKFPHQSLASNAGHSQFSQYANNSQNTTSNIAGSTHSSKYFTPLISPAMTPLESIMHPTPNVNSHDPFNTSDLTQGFFTPLTSPAINPVSNNPSPGSFFTINDFNMANAVAATMGSGSSSNTGPNTRHKKSISSSTANSRRTSKNYTGRILKQTVTSTSKNSRNNSPVIKADIAQRHPNITTDAISKESNMFSGIENSKNNSYSIDLNDLGDFSLPSNAQTNDYLSMGSDRKIYTESSLNNSTTSLHSMPNDAIRVNNGVHTSNCKDSDTANSSTTGINEIDQQHPVTPATLMNLKNKSKNSVRRKTSSASNSLPGSSVNSNGTSSSKDKLPIREITFQATPSPSSLSKVSSSSLQNASAAPQKVQQQSVLQKTVAFSSFKTYKSKAVAAGTGGHKSIMDSVIAHQSQFKLNLPSQNNTSKNENKGTSNLTSDGDQNLKKSKEGTAKKSSHREAEKGRRDRMNIAIHDLALLLPEYLTSTIAVPSKATTVELASMYIKSLSDQLEAAKNENAELKQKFNIQ